MAQPERILLRSSPSEDTTPEMGLILGRALAIEHRKVVIARDMMRSSTMMKEALVAGLLSAGVEIIDLGRISLPAAAMMASHGDCAVYVGEYREYGLISGYLLMNSNGSLFRKDQIRDLDRVFTEDHPLPDFGHLGELTKMPYATSEYNRRLLSALKEPAECSIVLNCNCGICSDSAPQILNALGADVISLNAQKDRDYIAHSMVTTDSEIRDIRRFVESEPGTIGVSLNRVGTLATIIDEQGDVITPETILALIVMFLRPKRVVVPMDTTSLVEDAFWGRIDVGMETPFEAPADEERRFVRGPIDGGTIGNIVANISADIGFYDGEIVFGSMSMMSDGIFTTAVISQIAAKNSLKKMEEALPEYHRDFKSFRYECSEAEFSTMMDDVLESIKCNGINKVDGWKVDMDGGWFLIRFDPEQEQTVTVLAESTDKAYLVGLMEVAGDIVDRCSPGQ